MRVFPGIAICFIFAAFFLPAAAQAAALAKPANNLGLIAYWSFNDASGTKLGDLSGNGHIGTLSGTTLPTWVTGRFSKGLSFTNSDNYVSIPVSDAFQIGTGDFTISHWIRFDGFPARYQTTFDGGYAGTAGVLIEFDNTAHVVMLYIRGTPSGPHTLSWPFTPAAGVWYNIVAKRSGSNVSVFVNGASLGSAQTDTTSIAKSSWILGKYSGGEPTVGTIDDFRFYNRALSDAEIVALYRGGAAQVRAPNNVGLVGSWDFNEGTGTIAGDSSGNSNDGTLSGSTLPAWASGKHGKALLFDGSTSYIPVNRTVSDDFTLSAWIKTTQNTAGCAGQWYCGQGIVDGEVGGVTNDFGMTVYNGKLAFGVGNSDTTVFSNADVNTGNWVLVTATRVKSTGAMTVYVNGVLDNTGTGGTQSLTAPSVLFIGKDANINPSASFFGGLMDDVRIYDRALSAAEIAALYRQGTAQINTPSPDLSSDSSLSSGLVGLWTFDGPDVTDKVYDRSGSGFNGYLVGTNNATSSRKTIGRMGQGFSFSGMNTGGINVGSSNSLTPSRFTISAWIYDNTPQTYLYNYVYSNARDCCGTYKGIDMYIQAGKVSGGIWNSSLSQIVSAATIATSTWTHVVFTYDGATKKIYINGSLDASSAQTTDPGTPASFNTYIGSMGNGSGAMYTFNGKLDDVRVYNRALPAAEVRQLYLLGQ
ncbi:MAG TPA: LamG domain-containing protein [Candidatus Paceibacterota bacterium]|nr:LamG domain-containing protein [Candidatus Paceibacterota bacterium]